MRREKERRRGRSPRESGVIYVRMEEAAGGRGRGDVFNLRTCLSFPPAMTLSCNPLLTRGFKPRAYTPVKCKPCARGICKPAARKPLSKNLPWRIEGGRDKRERDKGTSEREKSEGGKRRRWSRSKTFTANRINAGI